MINFRKSSIVSFVLALSVLFVVAAVNAESDGKTKALEYVSSHRWASSVIDEKGKHWITIHDGESLIYLTEGETDNKPSWSKEGDMLTFFRWNGTYLGKKVLWDEVETGPFNLFHDEICVINADGTGFKVLVDDSHANVNPTWTRDGTNQIIFNRYRHSGLGIQIYTVDPKGELNSERLLTHPDRDGPGYAEWAESGLKDGRIFIWRIHVAQFLLLNPMTPGYTVPGVQSYHLLDPKTQTYEDVKRPNKYPVHKLSVSPSETKVVYMKDLNGNPLSYNDSVIAYAEFDLENLEVKNEVEISPDDRSYTDMYPRWSPDEKHIIYSSSRTGKMQQYLYSLETKETHMVSDPSLHGDMFPCFEDMPK